MSGSRRILTITVTVLGILGLLLASVPFIGSLKPSAKAEAEWEAWKTPPMPSLIPGQVVLRQGAKSWRRENMDGSWSAILGKLDLLIRDYDGTYYSYRFPTWEGAVVMPRTFWGQWEDECKDFGPRTEGGMLLAGTTIQCNDPDAAKWPTKSATWSIDGRSLVKPFPDLPKLRCRESERGQLKCI